MDIFEKINSGLEPLEGDLFIDGFVQSIRGAAAGPPAGQESRPEPEEVPQLLPDPEPEEAYAPGTPVAALDAMHEDGPVGEEPGISETGRLRMEIEAFMNRDAPEDTDDDEVQEFLADRSGFDPSQFDK